MPPDTLLDSCSTCRWPDVMFHCSVWPIRLRSVLVRTSEDVIPILIVGGYLTPASEYASKSLIHRYRFPACLSLHLADMLTHNSTAKLYLACHETHVTPFQRKQFTDSQPSCDRHINCSAPRFRQFWKQLADLLDCQHIGGVYSLGGLPHIRDWITAEEPPPHRVLEKRVHEIPQFCPRSVRQWQRTQPCFYSHGMDV